MRKGLYTTTIVLIWIGITAILFYTITSVYFFKFYARPSVTYSNVEMTGTSFSAGKPFTIKVRRCSSGLYPYTATRELQNGVIYLLPQTHGTTTKGCQNYSRLIFTVPTELPSATYTLHVQLAFTVRWFYLTRVDTVDIVTKPFELISNDHDGT